MELHLLSQFQKLRKFPAALKLKLLLGVVRTLVFVVLHATWIVVPKVEGGRPVLSPELFDLHVYMQNVHHLVIQFLEWCLCSHLASSDTCLYLISVL